LPFVFAKSLFRLGTKPGTISVYLLFYVSLPLSHSSSIKVENSHKIMEELILQLELKPLEGSSEEVNKTKILEDKMNKTVISYGIS
jgi:hypothetical protein